MNAERKIDRVAALQHGVFSREQALASGFSRSAIVRRLGTGEWVQVYPSVYRLASAPRSPQQLLLGGLMWAGEDSMASHRSAAWLLGLGDSKPGIIEITVPRSRRAPNGITLHTSDQIINCDVARVGPIRVSTVARTLVDLGAVVDADTLEIAMEDALRRRLTSLEQLRRRLQDLSCKGRKGPSALQQLLDSRYPGNWTSGSTLEIKVLQTLRKHKVPHPIPQFVIRNQGVFVAKVDFAFPEAMLVVECESYEHHSDRSAFDKDVHRYNELAGLGFHVLRATSLDIRDPTKLIRAISLRFDSLSESKRRKVG